MHVCGAHVDFARESRLDVAWVQQSGEVVLLQCWVVGVRLDSPISGLNLDLATLGQHNHLDVFEAAVFEHFLLASGLVCDFVLKFLLWAEGSL